MKKEGKLQNIRAFAILSVVLGHSIIIYSSIWDEYTTVNSSAFLDAVKNIINIYEMPLFFSLSGYLFFYTIQKKRTPAVFFTDKFLRLIVPFVAVNALWVIPVKMLLKVKGFTGSYFRILYNVCIRMKYTSHLWFLITLFFVFAVFYLLNMILKLDEKDRLHCAIDIAILLGSYYLRHSGIKSLVSLKPLARIFPNLVWFYFGFCLCKYLQPGKKHFSLKYTAIPVICLFAAAVFLYRSRGMTVLLCLMIVVTPYLVFPLETNAFTEYVDRNSMGMFLFHSALIYISFTLFPDIHPALMVLINFVGYGTIASLMTVLVRKTPLKFMLGEK